MWGVIELAGFIRRTLFYYEGDSETSGNGEALNGDGRQISPRLYQDVCGMCGRTILTGETSEPYIAPNEGEPVVVCSICRPKARECGFCKVT